MLFRRLFFIALAGCLLACQETTPDPQPSTGNELFETPALSSVPALSVPGLKEASGLVASRRNPGLLWSHNDSGDGPRLFLFGADGKIRTEYQVGGGAINRDWEDMAAAEINGVKTLFVGDIGDNANHNALKFIYRFAEPAYAAGTTNATIANVETITFKLPDRSRNAETLLVDQQTKDLYILTKDEASVYVYRLPYPQATSGILTAEALGQVPLSGLTGGSISADNHEIILRTYEQIYYWKRATGESPTDALKRPPMQLPYLLEPQGEGVAFAADGSGYFSISETVEKIEPRLFFYKRK